MTAKYFQADWRQVPLIATPAEQALDRLAAYWAEANQQWFGGEMKPVPIVAGLEKTKRTLGRAGPDLATLRYRIEIRESLLDRIDEPGLYLETTDILLHEMIHQYLDTQKVREPDHGPEFTAWCNKIGSTLGLADVTARKPRGQEVPLSRYWPHCMRPAAAYALTAPRRIHWKRYDGQPLPRHTAAVSRPGRFGNPFLITVDPVQTREDAVRLHREWLGGGGPDERTIANNFGYTATYSRSKVPTSLPDLTGWDLACSCPDGQPCHGDTLLELANVSRP